ncbi:MAG: DUF3326 domain-containing protein [Acidobacteria bacterium]|nr:DUF3326 domain-containing protein [Acidobacteriota bacterium]
MIRNKQYAINRSEVPSVEFLPEIIGNMLGEKALRWYIGQINEDEIIVEATICDERMGQFSESVADNYYPGKSVILSIIPTGVGCNIGGYAGDAGPATSLLASTADYLITNPNAVNASDFIKMDDNVVYTEGLSIDLFCQGLVNLYWPYSNKVGLIIEKTAGAGMDVVFNILNAVRATHGVDIQDYVVTDRPIGGRCVENKTGAFVGTIDNPGVLFEACEKLIAKGVNAIGITSNIQDLPVENYAKHFDGQYSNPVGGVEAVISHLITRRFHLPAAHAPLLNIKQLDLTHNIVDARGAGEMASISGLACVLIGLQRAPQIKLHSYCRVADIINVNNLMAVVTPAGCLGSIPVLSTRKYKIPVIAVQENETILNITQPKVRLNNVVEVSNYAEAAGVLMALKKGISIDSISRPLRTLRHTIDEASQNHLNGRMVDYEEQLVA